MLLLKAQNLENQQETRAKNYEDEIDRLRLLNDQLGNNYEADKTGQATEADRLRREAADWERQC